MMPKRLRSVIIGTTGLCNASCIHCPTGKPETAHLPKRVMPLELFESIVRQIAKNGWSVQYNLSLGLFGDGLLDPFVVQRCEIARRWLPDAPLAINTNGAAYNRERHLPLVDLVRSISLHVESLRPEIYDHIMQPLRFERVFPQMQRILQDFGPKVTPGTPLHRLNFGERDAFLSFFKGAGAREVHFAALSNRCSKSSAFDAMSFAPMSAPCRSEIATDLIVDWDAQVLLCCNDFKKEMPVGDFATQDLGEVLADRRRHDAVADLVAQNIGHLKTCTNCKWDKIDPELIGVH